jgi:hypothetical protein
MALTTLALAATISLTPAMAVEQGRAMIQLGLGQHGDVRLRDVALKSLGADLLFCGQINVRSDSGGLTGWRNVVVVVSGNPNARSIVTGSTQMERGIIADACLHGVRVDERDYSAALNPQR